MHNWLTDYDKCFGAVVFTSEMCMGLRLYVLVKFVFAIVTLGKTCICMYIQACISVIRRNLLSNTFTNI